MIIVALIVAGLALLAALALATAFALHAFLRTRPQDLAALPTGTAMIDGRELRLLIPATNEQKGHGLSGQQSLPAGTGLWLAAPDGDTRIMMLGMRFALDLVWVDASGRVVHLRQNVRPGFWPLFHSSPQPATAVIELAAGQAHELGLDLTGAALTGPLR